MDHVRTMFGEELMYGLGLVESFVLPGHGTCRRRCAKDLNGSMGSCHRGDKQGIGRCRRHDMDADPGATELEREGFYGGFGPTDLGGKCRRNYQDVQVIDPPVAVLTLS